MSQEELILITKLYNLHNTRHTMSYRSIYHGTYIDLAINLNTELMSISGVAYTDYSAIQVKDMVAECVLLGLDTKCES